MELDICNMPKPTIVICPNCWAVYEQIMEKRPGWEEGRFACTCSYVLARWGSSAVPKFITLKGASK
jgi:hypothetical protein